MKNIYFIATGIFLAACLGTEASPLMVVEPPVSHPAVSTAKAPSAYQWRNQSGNWGEHLAEQNLKRRGFRVAHVKSGVNGLDRIAYRIHPLTGRVFDAKFVEVKTNRGALKLGETRSGIQGSRRYVLQRVRDMTQSTDPSVRDLGRKLRGYIVGSGRSYNKMAEIHHINTATGRYRTLRADGKMLIKQTPLRLELSRIARSGTREATRNMARQSLRHYQRIQSGTMSRHLGRIVPRAANGMLAGGFKQLAGPLAVAATLGLEAYGLKKELGAIDQMLQRGEVGVRQHQLMRRVATGRSVGFVVGGGGGIAVGAWVGGTLISGVYAIPGGQALIPFAAYINGAGAWLGGAIGGWIGSNAGGNAGESVARALSPDEQKIEHQRQLDLETWFIATAPVY